MPGLKDYYSVLGVAPDAPTRSVQAAYRRLAKRHHPDSLGAESEDHSQFVQINEAYEALRNRDRRAAYDIEFAATVGELDIQQSLGNTDQANKSAEDDAEWRACAGRNVLLEQIDTQLNRLSARLSRHFRAIVSTKAATTDPLEIAANLELRFLGHYFGNDIEVQKLGKALLMRGDWKEARELNSIVLHGGDPEALLAKEKQRDEAKSSSSRRQKTPQSFMRKSYAKAATLVALGLFAFGVILYPTFKTRDEKTLNGIEIADIQDNGFDELPVVAFQPAIGKKDLEERIDVNRAGKENFHSNSMKIDVNSRPSKMQERLKGELPNNAEITAETKPKKEMTERLAEEKIEKKLWDYPPISENELPYNPNGWVPPPIPPTDALAANETKISKREGADKTFELFKLNGSEKLEHKLIERGVSVSVARDLVASIDPAVQTDPVAAGTYIRLEADRFIDSYGRNILFPIRLEITSSTGRIIVVLSRPDGTFTHYIAPRPAPIVPKPLTIEQPDVSEPAKPDDFEKAFKLKKAEKQKVLAQRRLRLAEENCLARAIYFHAKDKYESVKQGLAAFILARVKSKDFPNTICGVVYQGSQQPANCAFAFACDGKPDEVTSTQDWELSKKIAERALRGEFDPYVGDLKAFVPLEIAFAPAENTQDEVLPLPDPPQGHPDSLQLAEMNENILCGLALEGSRLNWRFAPGNERYVAEAKRRNFSVEYCRMKLESIPPLKSEENSTNHEQYGDQVACLMSFEPSIGGKNGWQLKPEDNSFVSDMKKRKLTEDKCRDLLGI